MFKPNRNRPAIIISVAILIMAAAGTLIAGPNTLIRDEIPDKYKWNLNDIYPDWAAWEQGLADLEAKMEEYSALKGTLAQGPEQILKAYNLDDEWSLANPYILLGHPMSKLYFFLHEATQDQFPTLSERLPFDPNHTLSQIHQDLFLY